MKRYKCVWSVGDKKPNEFIDIASTDDENRLLSIGAVVLVEDENQDTETTELVEDGQLEESGGELEPKPKRGRPSSK